jgi:hypothetical protein
MIEKENIEKANNIKRENWDGDEESYNNLLY